MACAGRAQPSRIGPILDKLFGVVLNLIFERHDLLVGAAGFQPSGGRESFRRRNLPAVWLSQNRKAFPRGNRTKIEKDRAAIEQRAKAEEARWDKVKERLQAALRKTRE